MVASAESSKLTPEEISSRHVSNLSAFVLRGRRVEAHSLAADPRHLLKLAGGTFEVQIINGATRIIQDLPPEEIVESAAARVRPLALANDVTHWGRTMSALRHFAAVSQDSELSDAVAILRARWNEVTDETQPPGGYTVQLSDDDAGTKTDPMGDRQLAWAWIYGDTVHADAQRLTDTQEFGIEERFRAAVALVGQVMMATIMTMNVIRAAAERGTLPLPADLFTIPVTATGVGFVGDVTLYSAPVDDDRAVPLLGDALGPEWTPVGGVTVASMPHPPDKPPSGGRPE